jgi:hypothetical protein
VYSEISIGTESRQSAVCEVWTYQSHVIFLVPEFGIGRRASLVSREGD